MYMVKYVQIQNILSRQIGSYAFKKQHDSEIQDMRIFLQKFSLQLYHFHEFALLI